MSEIEFRALGNIGFSAGGDADVDGLLAQPKRLALFCYLAIPKPGRMVRRDTLLGVFWSERDTDHARSALRQALKHIRNTLDHEVIVRRGLEEVGLNPELFTCDVASFEHAFEAGNWDEAVKYYRGELLKGFFFSKSLEFEHWLDAERSRLASMQAYALEELAKAATAAGDVRAAVEWWQALVRHDPFDSRYVSGMMESLDRAGDPANALLYARKYRTLLREELDITLPAEIKSLEERVRTKRESRDSGDAEAQPTNADGSTGSGTDGEEGGVEPSVQGPSGVWNRLFGRVILRTAVIIPLFVVVFAVFSLLDSEPELNHKLVIVVPFENFSGDPTNDDLGYLAADWIQRGILQVGGLDVVPRAYARESALATGDESASQDVRTLAESAGAPLAVSGVIVGDGDSLAYHVEIVDVAAGTVLQSFEEVWPRAATMQAVCSIGQRVGGALAAETDPYMKTKTRSMPVPPTLPAYHEHRFGYEFFDMGDYEESLRRHLVAYDLDTMLVRAVVAAGYAARDHNQADSLANFAERRRHLLSRSGRADLDVLVAMLGRRWEDALRAAGSLALLEGGYAQVLEAWFAIRANRPAHAIEALGRYDPNLEWRQNQADTYWHLITEANHMLGRHDQELAEARMARERYSDRLDILNTEVRALAALGRSEQVEAVLDSAFSFPPLSDFNLWELMFTAGTEYREHGHSDTDAQAAFLRAADWLQGRPPEETASPEHRFALARTLYAARQWEESRRLFQLLAAEFPQSSEYVHYLGHLGTTAARLGMASQAIDVSAQLDDYVSGHMEADCTCWKARIAAVLGDNNEAMALLRASFREGLEYGSWLNADLDLSQLRGRPDFLDLAQPKR